VAVHPQQPHYLATASNDTTVKLWDTRKLSKASDALATLGHGRAATSAVFSALAGRKLLTTSYDDYVRVFDLGTNLAAATGAKQSPIAEQKYQHNNQTGRWLTNFRATWDPKSDKRFVIGSMLRPRGLDIYVQGAGDAATTRFERVNLQHENFTTVTSLNAFHPSLPVVAGGNSSGKVSIWR
jgi:WD40 repeat protein